MGKHGHEGVNDRVLDVQAHLHRVNLTGVVAEVHTEQSIPPEKLHQAGTEKGLPP